MVTSSVTGRILAAAAVCLGSLAVVPAHHPAPFPEPSRVPSGHRVLGSGEGPNLAAVAGPAAPAIPVVPAPAGHGDGDGAGGDAGAAA
jgi:hypothetical protein